MAKRRHPLVAGRRTLLILGLALSCSTDAGACAPSIPDSLVIAKVLGVPDPRVRTSGLGDSLRILPGHRIELRVHRSGALTAGPLRAVLAGETLSMGEPDPMAMEGRDGDAVIFSLPRAPEHLDGAELRLFVGETLVQRWTLAFKKGLSGGCPAPRPVEDSRPSVPTPSVPAPIPAAREVPAQAPASTSSRLACQHHGGASAGAPIHWLLGALALLAAAPPPRTMTGSALAFAV